MHARSLNLDWASAPREGRCSFGIDRVKVGSRIVPVAQHDRLVLDFGVLTEFVRKGTRRRVMVVAPLAGAYPILMRDLVIGLLRHANVAITDWRDPSYLPIECGDFGLAENIRYVLAMMQALGPEIHVVAVCQGTVAALAATALCSVIDPAASPRSLTLIAGPIDPLASPTGVVLASRAHSVEWFQSNVMRTVGDGFPGTGRRIFPASAQLATLTNYLARHWMSGEIFWKLCFDDGEDPVRFPFSSLITQLMNLPAELVLDTVRRVFVERALCAGHLQVNRQTVRPAEIRRVGLMTVEGERDDIAAPGQTYAAHALCSGIPKQLHRHLLIPSGGHFSLFYGTHWRSTVLPALIRFFQTTEAVLTPPTPKGECPDPREPH